jgi:cytochrome c553
MLAYKVGGLPASVMPQIAKGYIDAKLARLADFFGRQRPPQE